MEQPRDRFFRALLQLAQETDGTPEGETIGEAAAQMVSALREQMRRCAFALADVSLAAGIPIVEVFDAVRKEWDTISARVLE